MNYRSGMLGVACAALMMSYCWRHPALHLNQVWAQIATRSTLQELVESHTEIADVSPRERARWTSKALQDIESPDPEKRLWATYVISLENSRRGASILEDLLTTDSDPAVRFIAAVGLPFTKADGILPPLIKALNDKEPAVRLAAARALGALSLKEYLAPAASALQNQKTLGGVMFLRAIRSSMTPECGPHWIPLLHHPWKIARRVAAQAMGACRVQGITEQLLQRVNDSDPAVRFSTLQSLSQQTDPALSLVMMEALEDPDARVQACAADALGRRRYTPAVRKLEQILKSPPRSFARDTLSVEQFRGAFRRVMQDMPETPCMNAYYRLVHRVGLPHQLTGETNARAMCAAALGSLGSKSSIPLLIRALHGPDKRVAASAAQALAQYKTPQTLQALTEVIRSPVMPGDVKTLCIRAVGATGSTKSLQVLVQGLRDYNAHMGERRPGAWSMGIAYAESLGNIQATGAVPDLVRLLEDRHSQVRIAALRAIERIGGSRAPEELERVSRADPNLNVRLEAERILNTPNSEPLPKRATG